MHRRVTARAGRQVLSIGITGTHRSTASRRLTVRLAELDVFLRDAYGVGLAEAAATRHSGVRGGTAGPAAGR
jgi:hypothetical protein